MSEQTSEPTYTLNQARWVLALRECADVGHDWNIISSWGAEPYRITCGRCGWSGEVSMSEQPRATR